jgi:pyruvate formate lyase activating enzyme
MSQLVEIENDLEIKGIIESTFLDWDGKVVTTVYLPKCNLKCPFCHNWELIEKPENFITISISDLDRHLRENKDFLDGVCITGGEPTLYQGLTWLIDHIKDLGLKIKLDTNGTAPEFIKELIENKKIDYIAMDIKAPFKDKNKKIEDYDKYHKLAGVKLDLENIKRSIKIIMNSNIDYEFRTTMVPTLVDEEDVKELSKDLSGAKKYVLQQFVPDHARLPRLRKVKPYSKEDMEHFKEIAEQIIVKVTLRGVK